MTRTIATMTMTKWPPPTSTCFSTDCPPFQSWQSYVVFHSAMSVSQPGEITRILSGCTADEQNSLKQWHDEHRISTHHHVHFTPKFDQVDGSGKTYSFFNTPFGVLHFLEHVIGLAQDGTIADPDVMIVISDPDQIFLKPI